MEIEDTIAKYRLMVMKLHAIRTSRPNDMELQGLIAEVLENMVESLITLNELYHYRDPEPGQEEQHLEGSGNEGANGNA